MRPALPLILSLLLAPPLILGQIDSLPANRGYTAERCKTSADCRSGRTCRHAVNESSVECTASSYSLLCECLPQSSLVPCSGFDCGTGELCSNQVLAAGRAARGVCISASFAKSLQQLNPSVIVLDPSDAQVTPDDPIETDLNGKTLVPCTSSSQCGEGRICYNANARMACVSDAAGVSLLCVCFPNGGLRSCQGKDCADGEFCSNQVAEEGRLETGACISQRVAEAAAEHMLGMEIVRHGVCIEVEALRHLPPEVLLYEKDRLARVLCDRNGSCATPGHMVRYRRRAMMMEGYCEIVGCAERVKKVNSLRYRRGMTVPSATDDLDFTVFAAKYESSLEERILRSLIRVGL